MPSQPLTDDELAELDAFLLSDACDEEALAVDEVHGFFTALIVSPVSIPQEEWLAAAWGEPRFPDAQWRERMTGLMVRLYGDIAQGLAEGRPFEPLAVEVEEEGETIVAHEGWCFGFMMGVERALEPWEALPKDKEGLLAPMAQLSLLTSEEPPEMDKREYDYWVGLIPGAVAGLYEHWH